MARINLGDVQAIERESRLGSHWEQFPAFAGAEIASGGPDPHMAMIGYACQGLDREQTLWRIGMYGAVYNAPTAQVLWERYTPDSVLAKDPTDLTASLRADWEALSWRRERRAIRTPEKLERYLRSYAEWIGRHNPPDWDSYGKGWSVVSEIYGVGRYMSMRLLELYSRYCGAPIALEDLRPRDAWSPRQALALLYPEHAAVLLGGDAADEIATVSDIAKDARERLRDQGLELSWYDLQTLLCDWKQAWSGGKRYPGWSHDAELVFWCVETPHMQDKMLLRRARLALFPHECLGEIQGWGGRREFQLGPCLRSYGLVWSDLHYDFLASTDYADPVLRCTV